MEICTCDLPSSLESCCLVQPSPGVHQIAGTEPCSEVELTVNVKEEARCFLVDPGHTGTGQVLW